MAAVALGLSDTSVSPISGSDYLDKSIPPGCYFNGALWFNLVESSTVSCGTGGRDCICAFFDHSNAGSVSPSF
jgi:hypothetical protein